MKIFDIFGPYLSRPVVLLISIALYSTTGNAAVDTQPWILKGTIDTAASISGKSATLKKQAIANMTAHFSSDNRFNLTGEGVSLTGVWQAKKRDLKMTLDESSLNQILQAIKNDLTAQSNLGITLTVKTVQANALQNKLGNKLQGRILIKTKLNYPGYSNKTGAISLDYRFTGQPAM